MLEDFCGRLRAILAILTGKPIAEEDSGSAAVLACTVRCISTLATVKPELMSRQAHGVEVLSNLQGVLSMRLVGIVQVESPRSVLRLHSTPVPLDASQVVLLRIWEP